MMSPTPRQARMDGTIMPLRPAMSPAERMVVSVMVELTERSTPPDIMTMACPMVTIASAAAARRLLVRLYGSRNAGEETEPAMNRAISVM